MVKQEGERHGRRALKWCVLAGPLLIVSGVAAAQASAPLPLKEFMAHVVQRNAVQLWAWTAVEVTSAGEVSGRPKTEEEWEDAESDALTVEQLAKVLKGPDYRVDDKRWPELADALHKAAAQSADAAERKDFAALSLANDKINERCVACHMAFAPELEEVPPAQ